MSGCRACVCYGTRAVVEYTSNSTTNGLIYGAVVEYTDRGIVNDCVVSVWPLESQRTLLVLLGDEVMISMAFEITKE